MANNPKSVGQVSTLKFFLSEPMKWEFLNLSLNKLTILVGVNSSGKSFINKAMWMMNYIVTGKIFAKKHGISFDEIKEAQFAVDSCLGPPLTGTMAINYTSSATIDLAIKDGQVLNVTFNAVDDKEEPLNAVYMSANFRRFSEINMYLVARKSCGKTDHQEIIMEMVKNFKLWDIMYIERLIANMPYKLKDDTKAHLNTLGFRENEQIEALKVDLDKCDFIAECKDGKDRSMSRWYGSGHQSIVNIVVGQAINS